VVRNLAWLRQNYCAFQVLVLGLPRSGLLARFVELKSTSSTFNQRAGGSCACSLEEGQNGFFGDVYVDSVRTRLD
jgi:hypothetical protein